MLAPPAPDISPAGEWVMGKPLGPAAGVWSTAGLNGPRLDRAEIRERLEGRVEPWIVSDLLDAFEPAAVAALKEQKPGRRNGKGAPAETED